MSVHHISKPSEVVAGNLKIEFLSQNSALLSSVTGQPSPDVQKSFESHVQELLIQYLQLPSPEARALARLVTRRQEELAETRQIEQWAERTALLRTILSLELQDQLSSYLKAAAIGARQGFSLDGLSVISSQDIPGVTLPVLKAPRGKGEGI